MAYFVPVVKMHCYCKHLYAFVIKTAAEHRLLAAEVFDHFSKIGIHPYEKAVVGHKS